MKKNKLMIAVITISLIFSITAFCYSVFRAEPVKYDWAAVLVGCSSILVMILVTFQVYNALTIEKRVSLMRKDIDRELNKMKSDAHTNIVRSVLIQSQSVPVGFNDYNGFLLGLEAVDLAFKYDTKNAEECIAHLLDKYEGIILELDSYNMEEARRAVYSAKKDYKRLGELKALVNRLDENRK